MAFEFYSSFCKCVTRKRKIRRKKTKKLSQFLKSHISGTRKAILLKVGMWSAAVGGHVHIKIVLFHQGSTELRRCENCVFFLPGNILTGVTRWLLGPHDTLLCVLIMPGMECDATRFLFFSKQVLKQLVDGIFYNF